MLQGRLGNLVGAPSGYLQTLGPDVRRRVKGLKSLQNKYTALEVEFQKEILALEKKYLELYTPLYQKRAEVVSGKTEPTDAEVEDGVSEDEEDEEEKDEDDEDKEIEKVEGKSLKGQCASTQCYYQFNASSGALLNHLITFFFMIPF